MIFFDTGPVGPEFNANRQAGNSKQTIDVKNCEGYAKVETAGSLQTKTSWCLMADGEPESILSQLLYAKRALSLVRLVLNVTLFLLLHCTGLFLCIW